MWQWTGRAATTKAALCASYTYGSGNRERAVRVGSRGISLGIPAHEIDQTRSGGAESFTSSLSRKRSRTARAAVGVCNRASPANDCPHRPRASAVREAHSTDRAAARSLVHPTLILALTTSATTSHPTHLRSNALSASRRGLHETGHALSNEAGWRSTLAPCTATSNTSSGSTFLAPTDTDEAADPSEAISAAGRVLFWLIFGAARGVAEGSPPLGCLPPLPAEVAVFVVVFGQVTLQDVVGAPNTEYLSVCCTCTRFERINTRTSNSSSARL